MDLLKIILSTCDCEEFYEKFKTNDIDAHTLKILSEEDLEYIGIEKEKREDILKRLSNLHLPAEKKIDLLVDEQYIELALDVISEHLRGHLAIFTCTERREDTDMCDINLTPAIKCLENILCSMEKEIDSFECKLSKRNEKTSNKLIIFPVVAFTTLALLFYTRYICT